jgi:hypothetical protein
MEPFESGVIDYILKLLAKILSFKANFGVKLYKLYVQSEFCLEKYIKWISRMQHLS